MPQADDGKLNGQVSSIKATGNGERDSSRKVVDEHSSSPLFYQLMQHLRSEILSARIKPFEQLPSERDLCRSFGLSRDTVRRAIDELVQQGLVHRQRSKGSFVSPPGTQPAIYLNNGGDFVQDMRRQGIQVATRVLKVQTVEPEPEVGEWLALGAGESALSVSRLILGNGEPWVVDTLYVPSSLDLQGEDFSNELPCDILLHRRGMFVSKTDMYIEPVVIGAESTMLGVDSGAIGMAIIRLLSTAEDRRLIYSRSTVRGDRCRYYLRSSASISGEPALAGPPTSEGNREKATTPKTHTIHLGGERLWNLFLSDDDRRSVPGTKGPVPTPESSASRRPGARSETTKPPG